MNVLGQIKEGVATQPDLDKLTERIINSSPSSSSIPIMESTPLLMQSETSMFIFAHLR